MKSKKSEEIKLNLFQKVEFEPESTETMLLVLVCAAVFGISFFASGKILYDYGYKEKQSASNGKPERKIIENVLAAEDQKNEDMAGANENILLEEEKISEVMSGVAEAAKYSATKTATARKIAQQRAAEKALRRSAPVLSGSTKKLPSGLRVCTGNSNHPERGGAVHMDEDCCADYNETPNPRCYYSPEKMGILKKR